MQNHTPARTRASWMRGLCVCAMGAALALSAACGRTASKGGKPRQTVRLACVNTAEAIATTHLAKAVLEQKLGYDVKLVMVGASASFKSVADGRCDAFLDAWLPATHSADMKRYGAGLVDLGTLFKGARIGLVVPDYAPGKTIGDLGRFRKEYGGTIIGIDAEAGIMVTTHKAMRTYGLRYHLVAAGVQGMPAALEAAIRERRPIVVTGWEPHWTFARWKLRFLEDPRHVYGRTEDIHILARRGLEKDLPEAAVFLGRYRLDGAQLDTLLLMVRNDPEKPLSAAISWMRQHPRLIDGWIGAAAAGKAR